MAHFRSGFVAIVGRPNVGKSTLLNQLVGQKIAICSPIAQTTRHRIKGVVTSTRGQMVFLDTPGYSKPLDALGSYLTSEGDAALNEADVMMLVMDMSEDPGAGDRWLAQKVAGTGKFVLLVLNKVDTIGKQGKAVERSKARQLAYRLMFDQAPCSGGLSVLVASAKTGKNRDRIIDTLMRKLPVGPAYYDTEAVTDQRLRELAAETIREQVLLLLREELPHSVAVGIEQFEEGPERTVIRATLYVDQTSQKGMVIGAGGQTIKRIGTAARAEIETLLEGTPVFLDLSVKVRKNWRKDASFLKSLGLAPPSG